MSWTGSAQAALDAGEPVEINAMVHVTAKSFADGSPQPVGFWTGAEGLALTIEGEARSYLAAGDAMQVGERVSVEGVTVGRNTVSLEGVNAIVDVLRRDYDITQASADAHFILLTPGLSVLGTRRIFKGQIDGDSFQLDDLAGVLSLDVVSLMRKGTRIPARMRDEARDPMFKYAHIVEGDIWS